MINFDFLNKGLGNVYPPHFVHDFIIKIFRMLYSINWPNFNVWLLLPPEISGNMCLELFFIQFVTSYIFQLTLAFLSSLFLTWPKTQNKNWIILRTIRAFDVKSEELFIIFKGLVVAKDCPIPKSASSIACNF